MENEIEEKVTTTLTKLQFVKEIRSKTMKLMEIKERLLDEVEASRREEKCLNDFRMEMEMLIQEQMSHVEELRQIHSDIKAMETVIKESEQARTKAIDEAKRLHAQFYPAKVEVDRLRQHFLGLERLPELHEEEPSILSSPIFDVNQHWINAQLSTFHRDHLRNGNANNLTFSQQQHPLTPHQSYSIPQQKQKQSRQKTPLDVPSSTSHGHLVGVHAGAPIIFRQQSPPMKPCEFCKNLIHRNAPICPTCHGKAKSRNPKKIKKKKN